MATNIELYEALRGTIGHQAATMLAESIPVASELATKSDIAELRAEMNLGFEKLRTELGGQIKDLSSTTMRWMLTFFVPLWLGVYGTLAAIVIGFASAR